MSSRIVRGETQVGEGLPWRRKAEEAEAPALAPPDTPHREVIAALEERLSTAVRSANDREARAKEAGRKEGYSAGYQQGIEAVQTESKRAISALETEAAEHVAGAAAQAVDLRRRLRLQMEADLVRLAVAIARRVIRRELSVDPGALLGIVKAAVERIAARELLAVRVAPQDAPRVTARLSELMLPDRVEVIADNTLSGGSIVFDTTRGQHDASVETQIEEIDRGLADLVGRPE